MSHDFPSDPLSSFPPSSEPREQGFWIPGEGLDVSDFLQAPPPLGSQESVSLASSTSALEKAGRSPLRAVGSTRHSTFSTGGTRPLQTHGSEWVREQARQASLDLQQALSQLEAPRSATLTPIAVAPPVANVSPLEPFFETASAAPTTPSSLPASLTGSPPLVETLAAQSEPSLVASYAPTSQATLPPGGDEGPMLSPTEDDGVWVLEDDFSGDPPALPEEASRLVGPPPSFTATESFKHIDSSAHFLGRGRPEPRAPILPVGPAPSGPKQQALLHQLQAALRDLDQQMLAVYQPQVSPRGVLLGVEALLRWKHPDGSHYANAQFIPLAEAAGLMTPLNQWILRQAAAQALQWKKNHLFFGLGERVSVNVDAHSLLSGAFEQEARRMEILGLLDASLMAVECSEPIAMAHAQQAQESLTRLRAMGFSIVLDDFATSYVSLGRLAQLPLDKIKLDRSVIGGSQRKLRAKIAGLALAMGREWGIDVVAEGVETYEQAHWLIERGAYALQGFLFSRPESAAQLEARAQKGWSTVLYPPETLDADPLFHAGQLLTPTPKEFFKPAEPLAPLIASPGNASSS